MKNIKIKHVILYLILGFLIPILIGFISVDVAAALLLIYLISIPVFIVLFIKNKHLENNENKVKKSNSNILKNILNKNQKINTKVNQPTYQSDYNYFELAGTYYYTDNLENYLKDYENSNWKKVDKNNLNRVYKYIRLKNQLIKIEKEPKNKYDKNAIKASIQGKIVGHIARDDQERFLKQTKLPIFVKAEISGGPFKKFDPITNKYGPVENYGFYIRFYI